jgi:hypothetical protein
MPLSTMEPSIALSVTLPVERKLSDDVLSVNRFLFIGMQLRYNDHCIDPFLVIT